MDAKRVVAFVLLGTSLGLVFFVFFSLVNEQDPDDVPTWWRGRAYSGVVESITKDQLILKTSDGKDLTFLVAPNTRTITWGSRPIEAGAEVSVRFKDIHSASGSSMQARTIRALRGPKNASPSAETSAAPSTSASAAPHGGHGGGGVPAVSATPH